MPVSFAKFHVYESETFGSAASTSHSSTPPHSPLSSKRWPTSGLLQHTEMLRDGRLRDSGPCRQRPDRLLTLAAQLLEDGPARWIGEGSEQYLVGHPASERITLQLITRELFVSQAGIAAYLKRIANRSWRRCCMRIDINLPSGT